MCGQKWTLCNTPNFSGAPSPRLHALLVADSAMSTAQRSRSGTSTVTARPPKEGCGCKPNKDGLCCATKACGCRKEGEECGPGCDCGGAFTEAAPLCDGHQLPCALVTTKEGANRGRRFFGCVKSCAESCGFFRWAQVRSRNPDLDPGH